MIRRPPTGRPRHRRWRSDRRVRRRSGTGTVPAPDPHRLRRTTAGTRQSCRTSPRSFPLVVRNRWEGHPRRETDIQATDGGTAGIEAAVHARAAQTNGLLRFSTAGSVDDGKSTLIGRLLHDAKAIFDDQLAAIETASK